MTNYPVAIIAGEADVRRTRSAYPESFTARLGGREKRPLGEVFGLTVFGVNLTRLPPGAISALRHGHSKQDEFVYALEGEATLVTDSGETVLKAGMCAGFRAGSGDAHHLINCGAVDFVYLEVGDRTAGDSVLYPEDDLLVLKGEDGTRQFLHKDGTPY